MVASISFACQLAGVRSVSSHPVTSFISSWALVKAIAVRNSNEEWNEKNIMVENEKYLSSRMKVKIGWKNTIAPLLA